MGSLNKKLSIPKVLTEEGKLLWLKEHKRELLILDLSHNNNASYDKAYLLFDLGILNQEDINSLEDIWYKLDKLLHPEDFNSALSKLIAALNFVNEGLHGDAGTFLEALGLATMAPDIVHLGKYAWNKLYSSPTLSKAINYKTINNKIDNSSLGFTNDEVDEALEFLRQNGYNPTIENLTKADELLRSRTPNPEVPYKDLSYKDIYVSSDGNYSMPITDVNSSFADTEEKIVYMPLLKGMESLKELAEHNLTKAHEEAHIIGFPSDDAFKELMSSIKIEDFTPEYKKAFLRDTKLTRKLKEWYTKDLKNGDFKGTYEEFLVDPTYEYSKNYLTDRIEKLTGDSLDKEFTLEYLGKTIGIDPDAIEYLLSKNATEIDARLGPLILGFLGENGNTLNNLNGEVLKKAFIAYPGENNNMMDLYKFIDNLNLWDKTADLIKQRKYGKALIPPALTTSLFDIVEDKKSNGGFLPSLQDNERNNINQLKYTGIVPSVRYNNGGLLENKYGVGGWFKNLFNRKKETIEDTPSLNINPLYQDLDFLNWFNLYTDTLESDDIHEGYYNYLKKNPNGSTMLDWASTHPYWNEYLTDTYNSRYLEIDPSYYQLYGVEKAMDNVSDYIQSEGHKQRALKGGIKPFKFMNPLKRLFSRTSDISSSNANARDKEGNTVLAIGLSDNGTWRNYYGYDTNPALVGAHELFHPYVRQLLNKYPLSIPINDILSQELPKEWIQWLIPNNKVDEHDARLDENWADLNALRSLLKTEEIYDSNLNPKDNIFTSDMYDEIMKRAVGKLSRFLNNHTKELVINAINDIAYNDQNSEDLNNISNEINYAANGGSLKQYSDLSMRERALIIRTGVKYGLRDILSIRDRYNKFAEGGHIYGGESEPTLQLKKVNFKEYAKERTNNKGRAVDVSTMELFLDSLVGRNYGMPLRLALMATALLEMGKDGAASKGIGGNGILGLSKERMSTDLLSNDPLIRAQQIHYILEDLEHVYTGTHPLAGNWNDGGTGGPSIMSGLDGHDKFWSATNTDYATKVLNKSYVRPAERLKTWQNRANVAQELKKYMK